MSAFDPTIEPDDVERRLRTWMGDQHAGVDLASTYARIVEQTGASKRRPRFLLRPSATRTSPPTQWSYRWGQSAPIVLAALLLLAVIGAGVLVGSRLVRDDQPPSPIPSPPGVVFDPATDIESEMAPSAGERVTSRLFRPKVTFTATARSQGETAGDICQLSHTSARTIVLAHPKGCVEDVRFIRPWAVACGSAGDHPDADTLAAAILAIPSSRPPVDLGDVRAGGDLPTGEFREAYRGRVVRMSAGGPSVAPDVANPDHCALLPEPGSTDPVIEIRHDIGALFVLLDVDGELVVIRASAGGHDSASHNEAVARGYATADDDQLIHLLHLVTDIRFGR